MPRDISIDRLRQRALNHPNDNAYHSLVNKRYQALSWAIYHERVRQFAKSLIACELSPHCKVAILGFNRLEWVLSAIGTQYAGGISVGVYPSSSDNEVAYVVDHSDAEILVVENLERYERQVKNHIKQLAKIKLIILMSSEKTDNKNIISFDNFIKKGYLISDEELDQRQEKIQAHDVATMIYTSGTTGQPKSVMLSHESVAWTVRTVVQLMRVSAEDRAISYLPLAHVAEQMFTLYAPLDSGLQQYFASSFDDLKDNIKLVEPTVFFGVPRIYEKICEGIKSGLKKKNIMVQNMVRYFSKATFSYHAAHNANKVPPLLTNVQYLAAKKKIFGPLKEKIGFAKTRIFMVGAAPISQELVEFYCSLDMPIYDIYGQSENSGPASMNYPGQSRIGSVGKALPGTELALASDGEILIKGPHVFVGYYKDEPATKEVLKDGWLYSGDVGELDKDGYLKITDRKKDILITAGGKNISPQNLESELKKLPYVQSAVVVGDRKKYLTALLAPNCESLLKKSQELGLKEPKIQSLVKNKAVLQEIKEELDRINARLAPVEQIKKFSLLQQEFSIESGEYTPTMKVKRKFVNQKYKDVIENMYI
jgi:long-chain acyl-CoA synthetase